MASTANALCLQCDLRNDEVSWRYGGHLASITIRNLDDEVETRLRAPATEHHGSMEEEARSILHRALCEEKPVPRNLVEFTRECFTSLDGVEFGLPPRGPMREPPHFS